MMELGCICSPQRLLGAQRGRPHSHLFGCLQWPSGMTAAQAHAPCELPQPLAQPQAKSSPGTESPYGRPFGAHRCVQVHDAGLSADWDYVCAHRTHPKDVQALVHATAANTDCLHIPAQASYGFHKSFTSQEYARSRTTTHRNMNTVCFVMILLNSHTRVSSSVSLQYASANARYRVAGYWLGRTDDAGARAPLELHRELRRVGRVDDERGVGKHRARAWCGQVPGAACGSGLRRKCTHRTQPGIRLCLPMALIRAQRGSRNLDTSASLRCMSNFSKCRVRLHPKCRASACTLLKLMHVQR